MISFTEKDFHLETFSGKNTAFKTGIVLETNVGYSNYPTLVNSSMELKSSFGYPSITNANYWYIAFSYLQYAKNLIVVRPCDTTKHNMSLNFKTDGSVEKTSDSNCYNPTVFSTKSFDLTNVKLKAVYKYLTNTANVAIAICSSLENYSLPMSVESSTIYVDSLQNKSTKIVKKFSDLFEVKPKFNEEEFCVVVFKKDDNGLYTILDKAIVSYNENAYNFIESRDFKEIRFKCALNAVYLIETCLMSIISTSYESSVNTLLNSALSKENYLTSTRLYLNESVNCLIDFEYTEGGVKKTGLAAQVAQEKGDCFSIVGNYEYKKFLNKSNEYILNTLLSDFVDKNYLTNYFESTCVVLNMQNVFDVYNNKKIWCSCIGDIAGLIASGKRFVSGLEEGKLKSVNPLLFELTADMKTALISQNINFVTTYKNSFNYNSSQFIIDPKDESFKDLFNCDLINQTVRDLTIALNGYVDKLNIMPIRENAISDGKKVLNNLKHNDSIDSFNIICDNTNNIDYGETLYYSVKIVIPRYIKEIDITFSIKDLITVKIKRG